MIVDVTVPVLAESVPDATLLDWNKQIGEPIAEGEVLIELDELPPDECEIREQRAEAGAVTQNAF